jgi:signal transduction histidine kinase
LYDYNPDGSGPIHMFGAAVETVLGDKSFYTQVEQVGFDSDYLIESVIDEVLSDGIWLQIPFLFIFLGVSVWTIKRTVTPLKNISRMADSISPSNASIRLPMTQIPQEIVPLVAAVNSALDRLEKGLQHQRDFNANAAHQLRTPLAVLLANIDNLTDPATSCRLRTDVAHMSRIVSQLLLVAQLETSPIELNEVLELNDATAEIAAGLAPYAISLSKSIELIRAPDSIFVLSNAFAFRAALSNLIENALMHTPSGTRVRLCVTQPSCIEVIDSGPGIPADQIEHIFKRFWRADKNRDGAGLGLAIVQLTMDALHGAVSVANIAGGGARFSLHFSCDAIAKASCLKKESRGDSRIA